MVNNLSSVNNVNEYEWKQLNGRVYSSASNDLMIDYRFRFFLFLTDEVRLTMSKYMMRHFFFQLVNRTWTFGHLYGNNVAVVSNFPHHSHIFYESFDACEINIVDVRIVHLEIGLEMEIRKQTDENGVRGNSISY